MTLTEILADVALNFTYESLSEEVRENAKLHILDGLGVGLNGSAIRPFFDPTIELVRELGGNGVASVFGEKSGFPARYAAFLNSIIITTSTYQETHRASVVHPYSPVLSTALAVGEELSSNGRDLMAAVVAGYEVLVRICTAVSPSFLERGIQPTGAIGPIGAAVACGKLIGLTREQLRHALNHAGNFGGGALMEAKGARPYFSIQVGVNVEKGVLAALLAQKGVVGCDTILEGGSVNAKGFLQAYSDKYDVNVIREGLGKRLGIQDTGFSFYSVASFSRTPIDAILALTKENHIKPGDIKSIRVKLTNVLYNLVNQKISTAQASSREAFYYIPFHMALALLKGAVDSYMYTDETFNDPAVKNIMDRVEVLSDPGLDEEAAATKAVTATIVEIATQDGALHSKKLSYWRGDPENPATKEDIQNKFRRITSEVINPEQAEKLIQRVDHLETMENVRSIGELIRWS